MGDDRCVGIKQSMIVLFHMVTGVGLGVLRYKMTEVDGWLSILSSEI